MSKILQDTTAMVAAHSAMLEDKATLDAANQAASVSAYTAIIFHIAFCIDEGAADNKAQAKFEKALNDAGIDTQSKAKAGGPLPWFERQRANVRKLCSVKMKKELKACNSLDGIEKALKEKGLSTAGKIRNYCKPDLKKLSATAKAAVAAMLATDAVKTFVANLDEDQIAAFSRSIENSCRNVDVAIDNNDKAAKAAKKAKAKAELKERMQSETDAEDEAAIAS